MCLSTGTIHSTSTQNVRFKCIPANHALWMRLKCTAIGPAETETSVERSTAVHSILPSSTQKCAAWPSTQRPGYYREAKKAFQGPIPLQCYFFLRFSSMLCVLSMSSDDPLLYTKRRALRRRAGSLKSYVVKCILLLFSTLFKARKGRAICEII